MWRIGQVVSPRDGFAGAQRDFLHPQVTSELFINYEHIQNIHICSPEPCIE